MFKALGMLFLFLGISGYGISLGSDYRKHLESLKNIEEMITCLLSYITYERDTLMEAFENGQRRLEGKSKQLLTGVLEELKRKEGMALADIWSRNCQIWEEELTQKELDQLKHLFEQSGYLEGKMQLHTLETYRMELREKIEKLTQNLESKCRIYYATGIMGGVFFCVLLW